MLFVLKAIGGLVGAFLANGLLTVGFQQAFGNGMLERAGWTPGAVPPTGYMLASVAAALFAAFVGGVVAALIVGRAQIQLATAYATLFTGLALWANRATLLDNPHPYEWLLLLAPLVAMPLGAWLICCMKPTKSIPPTG